MAITDQRHVRHLTNTDGYCMGVEKPSGVMGWTYLRCTECGAVHAEPSPRPAHYATLSRGERCPHLYLGIDGEEIVRCTGRFLCFAASD
jgi:hypothetical protein